ncbi:MAG: hypothetical protein JST81_06490 [Bacteroidetes bacterium]|nr:hypothetical protein [Bacteroidota bacterium]
MNEQESLIVQVMNNNDMASLQDTHLRKELSVCINELILNNFDELIRLLYRIDVSEQKLKQMLKDHIEANAGDVIADLIIERQISKIKTRREFRRDENISEEEKW